MRNNPERSIERSTDHSSLRYYFSLYMSHQADALVRQAIADALNLMLHIIESTPGFALVTNISPVRATVIACVASVPVRSEREKWGESKKVEGRGWGRGKKGTLARKPLDFETPSFHG